MFTIVRRSGEVASKVSEIMGLAKDVADLPTENIPNASSFYTMDTQEVYLFDEENSMWILQD